MTATPKPATPKIDSWRKELIGESVYKALCEHDALLAWYDAEIARLSAIIDGQRIAHGGMRDALTEVQQERDRLQRTVDLLTASRVAVPSYKGVTYRGAKWWYNSVAYYRPANLLVIYTSDFTDDDHAPLLALRDAKPRDLVTEVGKIVRDAFARYNSAEEWTRCVSETTDAILALFASEAS